MRTDYYKQISQYVENSTTKEHLAYAMEQINAHRHKVSVYGRQLYRNRRLNDLNDIEMEIKHKMIELGIADMFTWAGVKVFIHGAEIRIKLE